MDGLTPGEEHDNCSIILEVSAGVGGQEAMLFAGEMFNMYLQYAAFRGWSADIIEENETDIGMAQIRGHFYNVPH